jgi:hypothetical protein
LELTSHLHFDGKKKLRTRERNDWLACIPNAHPGYIAWEQLQQNLNTLKANGRGFEVARASPPREGTALLQGRVLCGRCGRHLRVEYALDAAGWMPGTSATARMALAASQAASRSRARR